MKKLTPKERALQSAEAEMSDVEGEARRKLVADFKNEVRLRHLKIRDLQPKDVRKKKSELIIRKLRGLPEYQHARVVGAYFPMRSEVDLRPLLEENAGPHDDGKTVALPALLQDSKEFQWRVYEQHRLEEGVFGTTQPNADAKPVAALDLDLVILPAVSIDSAGRRIGYGGGFYDINLPLCKNALRCAVVFDQQRAIEIPTLSHDQRVDMAITEKEVIRFSDQE